MTHELLNDPFVVVSVGGMLFLLTVYLTADWYERRRDRKQAMRRSD